MQQELNLDTCCIRLPNRVNTCIVPQILAKAKHLFNTHPKYARAALSYRFKFAWISLRQSTGLADECTKTSRA